VIAGACVSSTVTVNEKLGPPDTEQFTVVVPFGKEAPEAGVQVTAPQLPVVVGAVYVTAALQAFASVHLMMFVGQVMVQPVGGTTVTVNEQLDVLPDESCSGKTGGGNVCTDRSSAVANVGQRDASGGAA
jgi:hypothetical protein